MDADRLIAAMIDAMPIRWGCALPGLCMGGNRFVDVFLTVDAAAIWATFRGGPSPKKPGLGHGNRLRAVSLHFAVPGHASVAPLSLLEGERQQWALPDLAWTDQMHIAFRIGLPPDSFAAVEPIVPLAKVRLTADAMSADGADAHTITCSQALGLPLLDEAEWRETPGDPDAAALIDRLRGRPALVAGAASGHPCAPGRC